MRLLPTFLLLASAILASSSDVAVNLDPTQNLDDAPNNSLFNRWRARSRFIAPSGWLNDPCGAMYDPKRDTYHLFYQWHSNHADWGNMSWGHATSRDLITWTDVGGWSDAQAEALGAGPEAYDKLGIWSGTAQPVNLNGKADGNLTIFYTSMNDLPVSPTAETQSLATSSDGGLTWQKYPGNPVLSSSPAGWQATGWRDPFFQPWPEMDALLKQTEPHYYVIFGSGIQQVGPRIPLYSAPASDLTNWTFLGALFEIGTNQSWGGDPTKTGSFAYNFEVSGVFSLVEEKKNGGDGVTNHYFITTGTEGGQIPFHPNFHWAVWAEGTMSRRANGSAQFDIVSSSAADWGNLYAITSFWDSKNKRRVSWGWTPEEMAGYGIRAQGFQGSMGLPRELFVKKTHNVQAPATGVPEKSAGTWSADKKGTYTVTTLGSRPLPDVVAGLRAGKGHAVASAAINSPRFLVDNKAKNITGDHLELKASISNIKGSAGFIVRASPGMEEYTTIAYDSTTDTITVFRDHASLFPRFETYPVNGYFSPYKIGGKTEALDFHVFIDGSLIEVYVNDRFALTTRVYPSRGDALNVWQYVSKGGSAKFEDIEVHTELANAWPKRPSNSSSHLIRDTPEQTNNGRWWSGL